VIDYRCPRSGTSSQACKEIKTREERERERRKYGPGPVHARARARRWPNAISDRSALQRLATDDPAALSSRLADKEELVCHLSPPKCTIHPPVRRFTVTRPLPTSRCGAKLNARAAGLPLGAEEGNPSFLHEQVKKPPAYTHMHARAGMPATLCPSTLLPPFPPFYPALFSRAAFLHSTVFPDFHVAPREEAALKEKERNMERNARASGFRITRSFLSLFTFALLWCILT